MIETLLIKEEEEEGKSPFIDIFLVAGLEDPVLSCRTRVGSKQLL